MKRFSDIAGTFFSYVINSREDRGCNELLSYFKKFDSKENAVVGQSGGPTGVINASLVGVIEEAKKHPEIKKLYGAVHAVAGMVKEEFVDLKKLSAGTLKAVAGSPSSALGSSKDKPDAEYCARILEVFRKRDIRYFFYIGGNDSENCGCRQMAVFPKAGVCG